MKVKAKAVIDGKETEVEVELDDAKYMTTEQHELRVKDVVKKRLKRHAAELMQDEEFVGEVLKSKGIDPKNPTGGKGGKADDAEAVARIQQDVREREVKPLKQQLDETTAKLGSTRNKQLVADLTEAFIEAGVNRKQARKLAQVEINNGVFGFDDETDNWAVKDGDGFAYAPDASKERPYKGVKEFAADWVKVPDNKDWLEDTRQRGPDLKNGGGGGGTTSVRSKKDLKTDAQKVAFIREHGHAKYTELPAE